jgi:hypothetical protein
MGTSSMALKIPAKIAEAKLDEEGLMVIIPLE